MFKEFDYELYIYKTTILQMLFLNISLTLFSHKDLNPPSIKNKICYSADLGVAPLEFPEVHQGKTCQYVSGSVQLSAAPLEHGSCRKLTHGWLKLKACRWSSKSSSCLACWNSCLSLRIRSWLLGGISLLQQSEKQSARPRWM